MARKLQDIIGRPSDRDDRKIVDAVEWMKNCPVNKTDVKIANDLFGPNLGSLKGKTVHQKGNHVPSLVAEVPYEIIRTHKAVTLQKIDLCQIPTTTKRRKMLSAMENSIVRKINSLIISQLRW